MHNSSKFSKSIVTVMIGKVEARGTVVTAMYSSCFSSSLTTCARVYQINIKPNLDEPACKALCSLNSNCKFVFRDTAGYCITYTSCDKTRISHRAGTTFSKEGHCPGSF